jgi:glycerol-3-phosphate dehydrogenase (NAD(P)+)
MRLAVIGAGAMGTSLAGLYCFHNEVILWGRRREFIEELACKRENHRYLPGYPIPLEVELSSELPKWSEIDAAILCIPTQHIREISKTIQLENFKGAILNTAKGLELGSFKTPCEILMDIGCSSEQLFAFSGPSHAEEMCRGIPTSLVLAGGGSGAKLPQELLTSVSAPTLRPYYSQDRLGVELGGALKNIIAIACGISDGLGYGMNTTSAIITRGLSEIKKYGQHRGAEVETFSGLSCLGDLVTTCCSPHSRNRSFGRLLVEHRENVGKWGKLAEGATTAKSLVQELEHLPFDMPLSRGVYEIIWNQRSPKEVMRELLTRPHKQED